MKLLDFLKDGIRSLYRSVKRFPVTILLSAVTTVLLIIILREAGTRTDDSLGRIAMVTALGVPLTLCITLAIERVSFSRVAAYGCYALGLILLYLYYTFLLPDFTMVPVTRYIAVTIALYLLFLSVPYLTGRAGFEMYVIRVLGRFLVTALYSAVLYAGLALTLLTVNLLLSVYVSGNFYAYVFFVVAGIFAPCFFLAGVPAADRAMEGENYPALLKVLLLYIVMPLILIYTVILYIYFIRILVVLEWPEGTVSHLVLWYSVLCAGVLFLLYPLVKDNKFAGLFSAWFPRLALPVIGVMFTAIWIRIGAYGLTENRYFVVILGLWVFGVMLYYSLRQFKNIVLPSSLALVFLFAVFGPWSAYTLSVHSQNARLEALAAGYNMLDGDRLQAPAREITGEDKRTIVSILEYFARSHSLDDIRILPSGFQYSDMDRLFGFSREDTWGYPDRVAHFGLFSDVGSMDVSGYDYLLNSVFLMSSSISLDGLRVEYLSEELQLLILRGDEVIYAGDLEARGLETARLHGADFREVPVENMTFTDENASVRVKLIFTSIYGNRDADTGKLVILSTEFYLLVKDKGR